MNAEAGVPVGDTTLLQRLKELDEKATPGPWLCEGPQVFSPKVSRPIDSSMRFLLARTNDVARREQEDDAALISAMRNALPAVVALVEAAQQSPVCRDLIRDELAPFVGEAT